MPANKLLPNYPINPPAAPKLPGGIHSPRNTFILPTQANSPLTDNNPDNAISNRFAPGQTQPLNIKKDINSIISKYSKNLASPHELPILNSKSASDFKLFIKILKSLRQA